MAAPDPREASNALVREYLQSRKSLPKLSGKVCIVTGAGSAQGIGRQAVIAFCENGARAVYAADVGSFDEFASLRDACRRFGTEVVTVLMDAADEVQVGALCRRAVQEYGRLDVFFANAGVATTEFRLEDVTPENFMRILQINLLSCVLAAKHASTAMQVTSPAKPTSRGSIVMTASVAGLGGLGNASGPAYGASKAGVINLTRALSWQLGRFNISINSINPGLIETSLNADAFAKSAKRGTLPGAAFTNAFGRHGIPEEVANVVVFLASDDSSYVTGQNLSVDAGWSASLPVSLPPPKSSI